MSSKRDLSKKLYSKIVNQKKVRDKEAQQERKAALKAIMKKHQAQQESKAGDTPEI